MKKLIYYSCIFLLILSGCGSSDTQTEEWGSFTAEKTYSYDNNFYALQNSEKLNDIEYITVSIFLTENDEQIFSFSPARARDFWGVCWERDTYNLWTQSGDIGTECYRYEENQWHVDQTAIRPDYIISKYD